MSKDAAYQRRLSTIIAVDVCGYSALVEQNEDQAIRAVDGCRALIADVVEAHGGRIFNHAGDGVMAETPSAVEGVRAAFQIHRVLKDFNEARPDEAPLSVRIGVNLGDVVAKTDGDLVGHGVNIAARLENIAKPGETVISHAVYEQVRGAVEELFEAAGYEKLKNIDAPIAVYRAHQNGTVSPLPQQNKIIAKLMGHRGLIAAALAATVSVVAVASFWPQAPTSVPIVTEAGERRIAVLPFSNIGGNEANQYFSDGITEEIISSLVRLDGLTVLGRTSSFAFAQDKASADQLEHLLGATHLLEGSVRRDGNRVRISAQLIDAQSGVHLWSETYTRDLNDVFALQEEIAQAISSELEVTLRPATAVELRSVDADVYEMYLRGRQLLNQRGGSLPQAVSIFDAVVARDPQFADGWAGLASALHVLPGYSDTPYTDVAERVRQAAEEALRLDANAAEAQAVLAAQDRMQGHWLAADHGFQKALAMEPNNIAVVYYYGEFLLSVARFDDAKAMFERAYEIDPLSPFTSTGVGWAAYFAGQTDQAEQAFERAWTEFGLKLPKVWEGLFTLMLDREDYEAALAFIDELPAGPEAQPLYRGFVAALQMPELPAETLKQAFAQLEAHMDIPYYWKYEALSRLSQPEQALEVALAAMAGGKIDQTQPLFSPSATSVWTLEGFQQVADGLGLTAYWHQTKAPSICKQMTERVDFCPEMD